MEKYKLTIKEIKKSFKIQKGFPLEIFVDDDVKIIYGIKVCAKCGKEI